VISKNSLKSAKNFKKIGKNSENPALVSLHRKKTNFCVVFIEITIGAYIVKKTIGETGEGRF
jgi:hypothetical protein